MTSLKCRCCSPFGMTHITVFSAISPRLFAIFKVEHIRHFLRVIRYIYTSPQFAPERRGHRLCAPCRTRKTRDKLSEEPLASAHGATWRKSEGGYENSPSCEDPSRCDAPIRAEAKCPALPPAAHRCRACARPCIRRRSCSTYRPRRAGRK